MNAPKIGADERRAASNTSSNAVLDETQFLALGAQGYNRVPIVHRADADLETPLSIYLKLANRSYTYLLESVIGGERFGRYSYIGLAAPLRIEATGRLVSVKHGENVIERATGGDPIEFVREFLLRYRAAPIAELPRFAGGLVGYFGYDTVRWIEPSLAGGWLKPDPTASRDGACPDLLLLMSDELAVVDNLTGKLYLIVYADPATPGAYRAARQRIRELVGALRLPLTAPVETAQTSAAPTSNQSREVFIAAVERAKEYIAAGDAMQIVLSQRFSQAYAGSPLALYRAIRALNPSPYLFYCDFGSFHAVGASPEILVRLEDGNVTVRPIAGTRPRGATRAIDLANERELLADPKECAEHAMLVDLARNDVGRVAQTRSIEMTELMGIERYSHVMHIVSNVEARVQPDLDWADVFRASFPAGTVSGAPKVRAMQIIDELEPDRRGLYAGALGTIGFNGNMDLAIAIRSAVVKDGLVHVQAGAGIVADSDPNAEYEETRAKAAAMLRAVDVAVERSRAASAPGEGGL
jgi:anthranilate synthase component I